MQLKMPRWIHMVWYHIRCWFRPFNRVHITTLPRGWTDRDEVLLHAAFQILVDFVEKEKPLDTFRESENLREVVFLYKWWTIERPRRLDVAESIPMFVKLIEFKNCGDGLFSMEHTKGAEEDAARELMDESNRCDDEWLEEDNIMLKRLIDVRMSMWT